MYGYTNDRVILYLLAFLTYGFYILVKKYKVRLIRIVMFSFSAIYLLSFIYFIGNNYNNLALKESSLILFIASFGVFLDSKHDIRGSKITELIRKQVSFKNDKYVFNARNFTDEEINNIEKVLKDIFYNIDKNFGYKKNGKQTIYIRKNKKVKSLRIVNILYYDNKEDVILLTNIYEKFAKENYGEVNIKEGLMPEIELRIVV